MSVAIENEGDFDDGHDGKTEYNGSINSLVSNRTYIRASSLFSLTEFVREQNKKRKQSDKGDQFYAKHADEFEIKEDEEMEANGSMPLSAANYMRPSVDEMIVIDEGDIAKNTEPETEAEKEKEKEEETRPITDAKLIIKLLEDPNQHFFYVNDYQQTVGPFTKTQIFEKYEKKVINEDTILWSENVQITDDHNDGEAHRLFNNEKANVVVLDDESTPPPKQPTTFCCCIIFR